MSGESCGEDGITPVAQEAEGHEAEWPWETAKGAQPRWPGWS